MEEPWLREGGSPAGDPGKAAEGGQGQRPSSVLSPGVLSELCLSSRFL